MKDYFCKVEVLQDLQKTTKRLEKEAIIEDAWKSGIIDFFVGAKLAYDPLVTFGVKKLPERQETPNPVTSNSEKFFDLCQKLQNREITGNTALESLQSFANKSSKDDWNMFFSKVLIKDLRCGVSSKTINKVLKKIAKTDPIAKEYLINIFECQLASDSANHPKHMTGKKMVDVKFDGIRLLTFVDIETRTVTQYTRNGKINENFSNLQKEFKDFLVDLTLYMKNKFPDEKVWIFDGEVVSDDFQTLMKQVNRKENVDTADAIYWIFDLIPLSTFKGKLDQPQNKLTQIERHHLLGNILNDSVIKQKISNTKFLQTKIIDLDTDDGKKQYDQFCNQAISQGLEGVMIKEPTALYECKRSKNWLKMKPVLTVDLEVVDVEIGTGRNADRLGNIICEGSIDVENVEDPNETHTLELKVSVGSGFSDQQRDEYWNMRDQLIGQLVEVKADCVTQNQDNGSYSLRFPRFERFRGTVEEGKI